MGGRKGCMVFSGVFLEKETAKTKPKKKIVMAVQQMIHGLLALTMLFSLCVCTSVGAAGLSADMSVTMTLVKLTNYPEALCIDGSPGAYYISPGASSQSTTITKWMIYFEGGAWCVDGRDCLIRSKTGLGSSKDYAQVMQRDATGPLSNNCTSNPTFCDYHLVYMKYCDGNSFAGSRKTPIYVKDNGTTVALHLQGHMILEAALKNLLATTLFANATEVLLTGCSAGGLAVFLHTEWVSTRVKSMCPSLTKYGAIPISGYFLDHVNSLGQQAFQDDMKRIFFLSEAWRNGVSPSCLAAHRKKGVRALVDHVDSFDHTVWQCNFAPYVAHYIPSSAPFFMLNSKMDWWQLPCILAKKANTSYYDKACYGIPPYDQPPLNFENPPGGWAYQWCFVSKQTNADARGFGRSFMTKVTNTPQWNTTNGTFRNGAFIDSCFSHCEGQFGWFWEHTTVQGTKMRDAVARWWSSISSPHPLLHHNDEDQQVDGAGYHVYNDCDWITGSNTTCNPTCIQPWSEESRT